jgi:low temperature requirement protein LtrA
MSEAEAPQSRPGSSLIAWFTRPPRRHGEVDHQRTVSFLELFYDLVFVVLIAQIGHHLAGHVSWAGVLDFAVVFGLVWIAWLNGSMYHELHGREDGRHRNYIFIQMYLLVLLAVFAGNATDVDGQAFALTYAVLLAVLTWQWYVVRRIDTPEYGPITARYIATMLASIAVMAVSAFVSDEVRLLLWGLLVVCWVVGTALSSMVGRDVSLESTATESMAERFDLFTIIVLGEVVVGVVNGIAESTRDALTLVTGMLALSIGFGFWWNYFDSVGRRVPRPRQHALTTWIMLHLPLTGAVAAAGAGMVSLIEHANDAHTPAATAWLLSGASAVLLLCVAALVITVTDDVERRGIVLHVVTAMGVGAVASLAIGFMQPQAWLLALLLLAVHMVIWLYAFSVRAGRSTSEGRLA